MRSWLALLGWFLLVAAVIFSGTLLTVTGDGSWYQQLTQPSWAPPGWVFGPAWTLNVVLMSVAAWRVWRKVGFGVPTWLFVIHLAVAGAFTPVFFAGESVVGGLVIMWLASVTLIATIAAFFRKDAIAGWLLVPYLAWIVYATSVATGIWWLNR
ncbi:MAG: TspO/MBR family protein [Planctomycetota bacterium]